MVEDSRVLSYRQVEVDAASALATRSRTDAARFRRPEIDRSYIVPVLGKAIRIIQLLEASDRDLRVDEITQLTGIARSTVYRILRTLSAYGYLPEGDGGIYSLTRRRPTTVSRTTSSHLTAR